MKTPQTEQATAARDHYTTKLAAIRADKTLSDHGRRQQIAELHSSTKDRLHKLRAEEAVQLDNRHASLVGRLFGTADGMQGASLISFRDAADRASSLTKPADAQRMMQTALQHGDSQLAAAIARRAVDMDWADVFGAWQDARRPSLPDIDAIVNELATIEQHGSLRDTMTYRMPPTPTEILGSAALASSTGTATGDLAG